MNQCPRVFLHGLSEGEVIRQSKGLSKRGKSRHTSDLDKDIGVPAIFKKHCLIIGDVDRISGQRSKLLCKRVVIGCESNLTTSRNFNVQTCASARSTNPSNSDSRSKPDNVFSSSEASYNVRRCSSSIVSREDKSIYASTASEDIYTGTTGDRIVAVIAVKDVSASITIDRVIACTTSDRTAPVPPERTSLPAPPMIVVSRLLFA